MMADEEKDIFADMASQLEDIEVPTDVEDLTKVHSLELGRRLGELDELLAEGKQLLAMNPDAYGRELHGQRAAIVIELKRRRAL
jgi:hypothetical protein